MSKNENNDEIGKALGLTPIDDLKNKIAVELAEMDNDVKGAKANIKELIQVGMESLNELVSVAGQSQHPRAYEVVSTLINTLVAANKDLAAISIKTGEANKVTDNRQIHNNFNFNGTAADLLKLIKNPDIVDGETEENNE